MFASAVVHPHMHGEYGGSKYQRSVSSGSPPHAWGILVKQIRIANFARFTPTCMGNTITLADIQNHGAVHPHMHGEYVIKHGYYHCQSVHPHMHGEYIRIT